MKIRVSLVVVGLASFAALAQAETELAQLTIKGGEQMLRPNPGSPAVNTALPPEANDVVKMSRAGVSEPTILNHVASSPGYTLAAEDVLTLHHRGVSLNVITAMLQHRPSDQQAGPTIASVPTTTGPNAHIFYPTPAKEAVPLTDPVRVIYGSSVSGYAYDSPSVIISRSSFYQSGYQGGGYSGGISTITTFPSPGFTSVPYSGGFYRYGSGYRNYSSGYCSPRYAGSSRCDYGSYRRGRW
jgi:hypothetical protein